MPELPSPAATSLIQPWKRSVMEIFDEALLLLLGKAEWKQDARLHVLLSLPDGGGAVQSAMERIAGSFGLAGLTRKLSIVRRYMYGSARRSKVELEVHVHASLCRPQTAACLHLCKTDFQTFSEK